MDAKRKPKPTPPMTPMMAQTAVGVSRSRIRKRP
jgi:hypothetical protein